jgi:hypothetical protein
MRTTLTVLVIGTVASVLYGPPLASQDKTEWTDLYARDLRDWKRDDLRPSPWHFTADRTLAVSAVHDEIGPNGDLRDGTLRFEFRFRAPKEKETATPKAAVYLRRTENSAGYRLSLGADCGTLTATIVASSDREKTIESPAPAGLARPVGYWNQVKINLRGKAADVFVNGRPASSFDQGDAERGRVVFVAEGSEIEFRRVMWKDAK